MDVGHTFRISLTPDVYAAWAQNTEAMMGKPMIVVGVDVDEVPRRGTTCPALHIGPQTVVTFFEWTDFPQQWRGLPRLWPAQVAAGEWAIRVIENAAPVFIGCQNIRYATRCSRALCGHRPVKEATVCPICPAQGSNPSNDFRNQLLELHFRFTQSDVAKVMLPFFDYFRAGWRPGANVGNWLGLEVFAPEATFTMLLLGRRGDDSTWKRMKGTNLTRHPHLLNTASQVAPLDLVQTCTPTQANLRTLSEPRDPPPTRRRLTETTDPINLPPAPPPFHTLPAPPPFHTLTGSQRAVLVATSDMHCPFILDVFRGMSTIPPPRQAEFDAVIVAGRRRFTLEQERMIRNNLGYPEALAPDVWDTAVAAAIAEQLADVNHGVTPANCWDWWMAREDWPCHIRAEDQQMFIWGRGHGGWTNVAFTHLNAVIQSWAVNLRPSTVL